MSGLWMLNDTPAIADYLGQVSFGHIGIWVDVYLSGDGSRYIVHIIGVGDGRVRTFSFDRPGYGRFIGMLRVAHDRLRGRVYVLPKRQWDGK